MKRFLSAFLIIPVVLSAQQKFIISGNLQGLPEGSGVSLTDANRPEDTLARGDVKNGVFQLTGTVEEPNLYQLNLDGVKKKSILFIGNESVTVKGSVETVQDLDVSGSKVHDDFEEFKKTFNPLFQSLTQMSQKLNAQTSVTKDDTLITAYKAHLSTIKDAVDNFVSQHKTSPVAPFVVLVTSETEQDPVAMERRYNLFGEKVKNGFYGKIINEQIQSKNNGAPGTDAIDFSQADPDGKQVSLSSYKGQYVLVDFWASWCRPCREENPNVVKAYNKYKGKNFTVFGVSLDNNRAQWLKAIKADNLAWTQVSDLKGWANEAAAKYKIQSIPQNILVDPSGKIIAKNLRGDELNSKLAELLK